MTIMGDQLHDLHGGQTALLRELDQLSDSEKEHIRLVLLRHEQFEQRQDQKVRALKDELGFLQRGADACADFLDADLSCRLCGTPFRKFIRTDRHCCHSCTRVTCVHCVTRVDRGKKTLFCLICAKGWEIWQISGEWCGPKKDGDTAVSALKKSLETEPQMKKTLLSTYTDTVNSRTPDNIASNNEIGKKLKRPGSDGDLLFARRSLHINAKDEPRSDRTFFSPMVKRFTAFTRFEYQVTAGLRQALFVDSSDKVGDIVKKLSQQNEQPASDGSKLREEVTVINNYGRKSVSWQENRGPGYGIDMSPKNPSKRIKVITPDKTAEVFPEVPMKETDPQLRLAFNYDDGQLEVYIIRCRNLPVGKRSLPSPYVKAYLVAPNGTKIKRKTSTKKKTCDPEFNDVLRFPVVKEDVSKWSLKLMVCVKRGLFHFSTRILDMTTMTVSKDFLESERPLWVHFHQ